LAIGTAPRDARISRDLDAIDDAIDRLSPGCVVLSRIRCIDASGGYFTFSLKEERSELSFRQRVRAFHLERVLRREHEERLVELVGRSCRPTR
jgi:hypothetical protein